MKIVNKVGVVHCGTIVEIVQERETTSAVI